jgi:prophage antirepressor-like protein
MFATNSGILTIVLVGGANMDRNFTEYVTYWDVFDGHMVRVLESEGEVYFLVSDVAELLGVIDSTRLMQKVEKEHKFTSVVTFLEERNPQRYRFVDIFGLMSMVYRSHKSKVNKSRFVEWALHRSGYKKGDR